MAYRTTQPQLFRTEALHHHQQGRIDASPLHRVPPWTTRAFTLLVAFVASALGFSVVATLDEYAAGPAVVRIEGRLDVVSTSPGTVVAVEVSPGDRVVAGDVLVRLDDQDERTARDRLEAEVHTRLVESLRHPDDESARHALGTLRSELEMARRRVEHRVLRADRGGVVAAVRVRPGHHVDPGDPILSVVDDVGPASLVALLPGRYRPMLEVGQRLHVELDGFPHADQWLEVEGVDERVIGPSEAMRYLGPSEADAMQLTGPLVIVHARLPEETFVVEGREYRYFDGLHATAEVVVRRQSMLVAAIPSLRQLWSADDDR